VHDSQISYYYSDPKLSSMHVVEQRLLFFHVVKQKLFSVHRAERRLSSVHGGGAETLLCGGEVKTPSLIGQSKDSFAWAINLQRGKWEWFAELQFQQVSMNLLAQGACG